ncbi:M14 metallopeptidase family protein [Flavobacteriaceae bacterium M23B6Z8]
MITFVNFSYVTFVNELKYDMLDLSPNIYLDERLKGRYIAPKHVNPILESLSPIFQKIQVGASVKNKPIHKIEFGNGTKKILMWSQMHGNESTTTKAVFDVLNFFGSQHVLAKHILNNCRICVIPMLNPDGSEAYTRFNHNAIDLNRDAQELTQPESIVLQKVFKEFAPDYCFNLHDQRTIFNVSGTSLPATVSFLAPAANAEKTITAARARAMTLIAVMNDALQKKITGQVGRYDDGFNLNCVGDTFQSLNTPTILFEAGHFPGDYQRSKTRALIWESIIVALEYIASSNSHKDRIEDYANIPENEKFFFDIIIRDIPVLDRTELTKQDLAIQFKEELKNDKIVFEKELKGVGDFENYFGHREIRYTDYLDRIVALDDLNTSWVSAFLKNIQRK